MTTDTQRTTWQLARLAKCGDPDRPDGYAWPYIADSERPAMHEKASAGARFLRRVEDEAIELAESRGEYEYLDDGIQERADSAVPIYTHELWSVFVDLGAYEEDTSELTSGENDMSNLAGIALYMIAERLIRAILDENDDTEADEVDA